MTSIITVRREAEILLLTDGLGRTLAEGPAVERTKCALIPCGPALLAARGMYHLLLKFAADCVANGLSFDGIRARGKQLLLHYAEASETWSPEEKVAFQASELYLAGLSQSEGLASYMVAMDDRYEHRGRRAFEFYKMHEAISIAPGGPEIEPHLEALGYSRPSAAEFDPLTHGVQIMNAQRSVPDYGHLIGEHIQLSSVTVDGTVSSRVIHPWPSSAEN
jgi:hypothetical protein